jgi:hypothetical protein
MFRKLVPYIAFLIALNILSTYVFAADFRTWRPNPEYKDFYCAFIEGEIKRGDFLKLKNLYDEVRQSNGIIVQFWLKSDGGDVIEAMKIGSLIRKYNSATHAPSVTFEFKKNDTCDSACFLIWAGGIIRAGERLGVHRPYFEKEHFKGLSSSEAQVKYNEMSNIVKKYLEDMDIPKFVIEKMFEYGSEGIFYLDKTTVKSMLNVPFFEEWIIANCGKFTDEEWNELNDLRYSDKELSNAEKHYMKYLKNKEKSILTCRLNKIKEHQLNQK